MSSDSQHDLNEVEHDEVEHMETEHQEDGHGTTAESPESEVEEHQSVSEGHHELHASGVSNAVLNGDSSDDHLYGGRHDDVLDGEDGDDVLDGDDGDDILIAGGHTDHGDNSLHGGAGDDVLIAGGAKTLELHDFLESHPEVGDLVRTDARFAGALSLLDAAPAADDSATGTNTFDFHSGNGNDFIYNFHAHGDKVHIDRGLNGSDITDIDSLVRHITVSGDDLTIDLGQGNSVTLVGVDVAHLSADNVLWG